jgi:hypothetical protein
MTRSTRFIGGALIFSVGLAAGIYLQHRWPVGRWRQHLAPPPTPAPADVLAAVRNLPPARRLVIVTTGQSNAANYGQTRASGGAGVHAFADTRLFAAIDPLPGGDGDRGSIWTRLGARLINERAAEAVVFAVVAEGSTRASDWAPGGRCHARLAATLRQLAAANLPADFILWQQGETEADASGSSGGDYEKAVASVFAACREIFPRAEFLAASATFRAHAPRNEQIRLAQAALARLPGASPGPDLDRLDGAHRSDGVHFSTTGLAAAADLWLESLRPALARRQNAPAIP